MKILQVNNYNNTHGGANLYYNELCNVLKKKVEVLQCYSSNPYKRGDQHNFILRELDIEALGMDALRYFYRSSEREKFRNYLLHHKPDVAHIHIFQGQISWSLLNELKQLGIPIVQTLHDLKIICPTGYAVRNNKFCNSCLKSSINCMRFRCNRGKSLRSVHSAIDFRIGRIFRYPEFIDHFICVSRYQRNIISSVTDSNKTSIIHNFSQTKSYDQRLKKMIDGEYLFYPTRLVKNKGIEELIKIYIADQQCLLPKVVIAGNGENFQNFQNYVSKYQLSERIHFYGQTAGEELDNLYQNCICVINLSQLNETFGLTSIEAFSHGKRIIVSNKGALPEIVDNQSKGLIIDNFDNYDFVKDNIIKYLRELSTNDNSNYLREQHYNKFSQQKHLEKIIQLYSKVMSS